MKTDTDEIIRALRLILAPGQVTELRALEATTPNYSKPRTMFGYFDDPAKLAAAVKGIASAKGIYFTPNPVTPALLARAQNRLKDAGKSETTSDKDTIARRWLLIDCDAVRPAGISASDAEHRAALACAQNIWADLAERGWPEPIMADSGNGAHLLYRVDLPADDGGVIEKCLHALADQHGGDAVAVDRSVHNPARIWKLYGTMAAKGDSTVERPHRMARIVEMPANIGTVTRAQLEELAAQAPVKETPKAVHQVNGHADSYAWLDAFLVRNASTLPPMTGPEPYEGGRRWVFDVCPWNSEHRNGSAFLIQRADGTIQAGCHHNGCAKENWHTLRAMIEPTALARKGNGSACSKAPRPHAADKAEPLDVKAAAEPGAGGDDVDKPKHSQATMLVGLATESNAALFHDDDRAYASVRHEDNHRENHSLNSKAFKLYLAKLFYKKFEKAPGAQALADAINTLSGMAIHEGPQIKVAVRTVGHDGSIYLDLADEHWQVARVTTHGWDVIAMADCPVKFVRRRGMQSLPLPVRGGSLEELRPLLNAKDDPTWVMMVAWVVMAMHPRGPYPALAMNGEQGSAKSTACRMLRRIIDPNEADLRTAPRDERDLVIAANNSRIVAFDNLSKLPADLSDALCRLATGGGFGTRELYTDDEEKLFSGTSPVMFNGIEDVGTRPDLLERSVTLSLRTISDTDRKDEEALWRSYEAIRPRVLGALLDAVSCALKHLPGVKLGRMPRMADFARWISAAEAALPWKTGTFLSTYEGNRNAANEMALESSPVGQALMAMVETNPTWQGTASELLRLLTADDDIKHGKDWPDTPKKLANAVRRIAPVLRRLNVEVVFGDRRQDRSRAKLIRLERTAISQSAQSTQAEKVDSGEQMALALDRCGPSRTICGLSTSAESPPQRPDSHNVSDHADRLDLAEQGYSGEEAA